MALDTAAILTQIDDVLARAQLEERMRLPGQTEDTYAENVSGRSTAVVATIDRLTPPGHHYREAAHKQVDEYGPANSYGLGSVIGILRALRADVEAGYTQSLVELVHADVFADFLAMATELQHKGFKDAAAVIAGSTLEEHLRKLAAKAQLPTTNSDGDPLKASRINDDLRNEEVYNALEHRQVQSWLDIRNAAAHGEYDEYDHAQVAGLIQGVGDFMVRHAA